MYISLSEICDLLLRLHSSEKCVCLLFVCSPHPLSCTKVWMVASNAFLNFLCEVSLVALVILHKGEGNANQAFHLNEVIWESVSFIKLCK